jgi:malonyl CoA-acyl carrier protein transacylase
MFYALGEASGSKVMKLPFSGRNEKLETMNRILTEAAQKRTERTEELERRVTQLEGELEVARQAIERAKALEVAAVAAAERAHLLNEKDKELANVREAATKYALRIQELERTLAEIVQKYNVPMDLWRGILDERLIGQKRKSSE